MEGGTGIICFLFSLWFWRECFVADSSLGAPECPVVVKAFEGR